MLAADSPGIFEGPYCRLFSLTILAIRSSYPTSLVRTLRPTATSRGAPPARLLPGLYSPSNCPELSIKSEPWRPVQSEEAVKVAVKQAHTIWHRACAIT
jgi:hypothetical protein